MFKLGRKPLEIRWTQAYRQEHKKDNKDGVKSSFKENTINTAGGKA